MRDPLQLLPEDDPARPGRDPFAEKALIARAGFGGLNLVLFLAAALVLVELHAATGVRFVQLGFVGLAAWWVLLLPRAIPLFKSNPRWAYAALVLFWLAFAGIYGHAAMSAGDGVTPSSG